MAGNIPPPPPGYTLVAPSPAAAPPSDIPPPPSGYTLKEPSAAPGTSPEAQQAGGIPSLDYVWKMLTTTGSNIKSTVQAPEFAAGVRHAFTAPFEGTGQLLTHAAGGFPVGAVGSELGVPPPITDQPIIPAKQMDVETQRGEQAFQKETAKDPLAASWGQLVGGVLHPLNLAVGGGIAGAAGRGIGRAALGGAAAGAVGGAMQPVTEGEDYWSQKEKQVGGGLALGGAIGGAAGAVTPRMSPGAQRLVEGGMSPGQMTAGQLMGPAVRRIEESGFKNFPILSSFVRGAESRSLDDFQRATINQALDPIGASLPRNVAAGNESIRAAGNAISKAYDDILARVPIVHKDQAFAAGIEALVPKAKTNPDVWRKFEPILDDVLDQFETVKGTSAVTGRKLKQIDSELARQARGYATSEDFDKRELAQHISELRTTLMESVERQYPDEAVNIRNANSAYAMLTRIEQAASARRGSEGRFTPGDLLGAVRSQAGGVRRRQFARGDALFQDWAQAAQRVLPSKVAESGTVERQMMTGGLIELPAMIAGHGTEAAMGMAGIGVGGSLPYTSVGQRLVGGLFSEPGAIRSGLQFVPRAATPGITSTRKRKRSDVVAQP